MKFCHLLAAFRKILFLFLFHSVYAETEMVITEFPSAFYNEGRFINQGWSFYDLNYDKEHSIIILKEKIKDHQEGLIVDINTKRFPFIRVVFNQSIIVPVGGSVSFSMDYSLSDVDLSDYDKNGNFMPGLSFSTSPEFKEEKKSNLASTYLARNPEGGASNAFIETDFPSKGSKSLIFDPIAIGDDITPQMTIQVRHTMTLTHQSIGKWKCILTLFSLTENSEVLSLEYPILTKVKENGSDPIYAVLGAGGFRGQLKIHHFKIMTTSP